MVDKISFQILYDELYRRSKYNEACCQNCMNDRKQIAQELSQRHQQIQKLAFAQKAKNCCEASRHVKDEIPKDINATRISTSADVNISARTGYVISGIDPGDSGKAYPHWSNSPEALAKMRQLFGGVSLPPGTEIYYASTPDGTGVNQFLKDIFCFKCHNFYCECDE